jgi:hypothetical protein
MPHRRPSRLTPAPWTPRGSPDVHAARPPGRRLLRAEVLERRRLLTTITGFGLTDPFTGTPLITETDFTDGSGHAAVIYSRDVDFTVIGAHRQATAMDPAPFLSDLQQYPLPVTTPASTGTDVYKIYVTASAADSFIAITEFTSNVTKGPPYTLTPYSGSPGTIGVANAAGAETGASVLEGGVGGILIGGVTFGPLVDSDTGRTDLDDSLPYLTQIGDQPLQADGTLRAGIEVIPTNAVTGKQNDFGNLIVGGDVTGSVSFGGNLNEFYAGSIDTGLSEGGTLFGNGAVGGIFQDQNGTVIGGGITGESARPDPGNFSVAGDLRDLITSGNVGTDDGVLPAMYGNPEADPALFNYVSDFDLTVGGTLGQLNVGGTFAGTVEVTHNPVTSGQTTGTGVVGLTTDQTEVEHTYPTDLFDAFQFEQVGLRANVPANVFAIGQIDLTNDTAATAQILGTIPETNPETGAILRDASGNELTYASVDGTISGAADGDADDYYGMAFMGGTTYTLTLSNATRSVSATGEQTQVLSAATPDEVLYVYDPDGRLIQSNVEANGGSIQVKADRPGIYKFEVVDTITNEIVDYNLTITGTGDLGIGGIIVGGDYNDTGIDGAIALYAGDLGAITVGGAYYALTDGPTFTAADGDAPTYAPSSIVVAAGNLRTLTGGTLGEASVVGFYYSDVPIVGGTARNDFGPIFNIPDGGIGLIESVGVMDLYSQFDPNYLRLATPQYVTNDAYAQAISGSIQVIDSGGLFVGWVAVDAGIGTINAASMASNEVTHIDVNADNVGNDGIIDLIDCAGDFGVLGGGPVLTTNTGGHVRYLVVGGAIYLPAAFGGVEDQASTSLVGQAATVTDDAGNSVTLTPEGVDTTTTVTTPAVTTTGTTGTTTTTGTTGTTGTGSTTVTTSPAPGELVTTTTDAAGDVTVTTTTGPQLSVLSYPVSDKGGQILVDVSVANGTAGDSASLVVSANGANGAASEVDIGTVTISGAGRPTVETGTDAFGNVTVTQPVPANASTSTNTSSGATGTSGVGAIAAGTATPPATLVAAAASDPTDLFLLLTGSATINALNTVATSGITLFSGVGGAPSGPTIGTPGVPVEIANTTPGEMVDVTAAGIGTLSVRGNLGFATPEATPAAVLPSAIIAGGNAYPFVQQHTGVVLTGDAVNIDVRGAVGNVIDATGTIQNLVADFGNHPAAGVFAGIVGPIEAARLLFVEVGQGLAATGTGAVAFSGLFATDKIGEVTNGGVLNGDVRGNIVTLSEGNVANADIDLIQLGNASIVGSRIFTLAGTAYPSTAAAFQSIADVGSLGVVVQDLSPNPVASGPASQYDVGAIKISGDGGILGVDVGASGIGPITVGTGGFGVLRTTLESVGTGRIGDITAAGYGVRQVDVENGGYIGAITATGNGSNLPVTAFPLDVRPSDVTGQQFDPFTGNPLTIYNDLNAALGGSTSAGNPSVTDVTDTGVIEDLLVQADQTIVGIAADKVRTSLPLVSTNVVPEPAQANIPVIGTPFADSLTTSGAVGYVRVGQLIDGLQITAGSIGQFTQNGNVNRLGIDVAGGIANLTIHGNLGAVITDPATLGPERDSYIYANGQNGHIDNLTVDGNLYADVFSSKYIGRVTVQGDLDGNLTNGGVATNHLGVGTLTVAGSIAEGSLDLTGTVGTIITGGSLGVAGQSVTIGGSINRLIVGAGHAAASALALDLTVDGTVQSMLVNGRITGNVHVTGDVRSLKVSGNAANPDAIAGAFQVDGRLFSATVTNGNVGGSVTATFDIGSFTINRGSLLAGATIQSTLGSIRTVRVIGGTTSGIAGSILAPNGTGLNVTTTGNVGNGATASAISALSGGSISIGGSVLADATVSIATTLDNLFVGGDIQAGAMVAGHPIRHSRVRGTTAAGTLVTT